MAIQNHLMSLIFGSNQNGLWDSLLVINSNFGRILHRFRDTLSYQLKSLIFSTVYYPLSFCALSRIITPFKFLEKHIGYGFLNLSITGNRQ